MHRESKNGKSKTFYELAKELNEKLAFQSACGCQDSIENLISDLQDILDNVVESPFTITIDLNDEYYEDEDSNIWDELSADINDDDFPKN